jgi:formamidopyrimidine-DNA glycosylase
MPRKTPGGVPELPEVETIRRDLDRELRERRIERVDARASRSIRRHPDPAELAVALLGATVESVGRRGKYLVFPLDRGGRLVVHLGMSGQLLLCAPDHPMMAHTHVVLTFDGGRQLRFVDPRTFGEVFVSNSPGGAELAHLGADPLHDLKDWADLAERLHARRSRLKPLLMDQRFLAGIGNLYADEILFAARLRYDRASDSLTPAEVRRLYRAMTVTLTAAISHRGSSLADEQYRDVFGQIGDFQSRHQVYGREGRPCGRCRQTVVRIKAAGRSTFLCPRCQP